MADHEFAADDQPRKASAAPGLEGEGGQYVDGDYADVGSVEAPADDPADAIREELIDGQVNATDEERGPLHGDEDHR